MTLWSSEDAAQATKGRCLSAFQAQGLSIDTRSLQPGDLFIALSDRRDGHDFVAEALRKGAVGALVSRVPDGVCADAPLLLVSDVMEALQALARGARARTQAKVIAITGSVGKTGTKDMLRSMLSAQGRIHAAERSFNNHWGVPLTLASMPQNTDVAIIEIGMNAPGEIAPLARLAKPDVAVITTVAPVHIENFVDGLEGIAREKAAILEGLAPSGIAILNRDDETFAIMQHHAQACGSQIITFGAHDASDFHMQEVQVTAEFTSVTGRAGTDDLTFRIAAPGRHLALNAMAAFAATRAVHGDFAKAAHGLARWTVPEGRGARWHVTLEKAAGDILVVDDAFNANPTSLAASLEAFATLPLAPDRGRRIAFLTDMLELGENAQEMHRAITELPVIDRLDQIHCAGPLMHCLHSALSFEKAGRWEPDANTLAGHVGALVNAGDVILVKGSKGSRAAEIVSALKALGVAKRADVI